MYIETDEMYVFLGKDCVFRLIVSTLPFIIEGLKEFKSNLFGKGRAGISLLLFLKLVNN